jgi:hypothetical protein
MPLRDHFRPPVDEIASWEELHGQWPAVIVHQLRQQLPAGYVAGPRVHSGSQVEVDVDEYEVRIYDATRGRLLVAAIELVSPANKDRPESRNVFVAKSVALLQQGVAVSIVDIVSIQRFNLYAELLTMIGHSDPTLGDPPPQLYAASYRWVRREKRTILEAWSYPMEIGQPLPTLPLWLSEDRVVPLNLEQSYEQACDDLRIE